MNRSILTASVDIVHVSIQSQNKDSNKTILATGDIMPPYIFSLTHLKFWPGRTAGSRIMTVDIKIGNDNVHLDGSLPGALKYYNIISPQPNSFLI